MKCPSCPDATLTMSERQGIEIDYCPQCRGIWLDRGELDKLLDRSAQESIQATAPLARHQTGRPDFVDSDYPRLQGQRHHSKKSWLSDFFD
ncbi:MAG: hypothetical protein EOP36_04265 [Rubrivivax sp.]|nr:MAG: hypothetical protein EOP36_04265 [Rubrivivax sp.]